ncbi:hypothetical protein O1611_g3261 [Lasiodiplodia mahajangana]|uniref:Uncharacterized protein n=1 Tax=Lasiodiplodia mahajangana TaxID=1108764 RepID=A0ACC2JS91_9PEZI|nr:hypothetical protein O1611_g3261 [Lasiodiplodia mahajangana]
MALGSDPGLYPQYKKDTQVVARWLERTSKTFGFTSLGDTRQQTGAKKQYTISIADFGHMADFLSLKDGVFVPEYLWTSLSRAIRYRSSYGSYLQRQRDTNNQQDKIGDKKHLFFIDVLKNVKNALSRVFKRSTPTIPPVARLASLDISRRATVEDDVESDVESDMENDVTIPERVKESPEPSDDDVVFEPWKEDDEEAMFLWRLFNVDVQRIRKQIRQLWELYRAGNLGLAGVATAHHMAIHMVPHFVKRYVGTAEDEKGMNARIKRLFYVDGVVAEPTVEAIIDGFDIAEEEMVFAWQVLISEAWTWSTCGSFGSYNGKWGPFTPRDDRENMTNLEKYFQDKALACGVVTDAQVLAVFLNPAIEMNLDELSAAIEDMVPWGYYDLRKRKGKKFPSSYDKITFRAVFATQLLLDSAHVLGTSIDRPWTELLNKTARIFKSAKSLREFYEGAGALALGGIPDSSYVKAIEKTAQFWQGKEDPISEFRREVCGEAPSNTGTEKPCTSLRYSAPLCGWWVNALQSSCHSRSIHVVNSLSLPIACARLYYAFVQEGLVPKGSWPDIEAFSILHRGDLWVGAPPKSGQYIQNTMMAGGNSIVSLASDARANSQPINKKRTKFVTLNAVVSNKIFTAFVERRAQGLSEDDIERLIVDTRLRWYNGKAVRPCFHHGWDKAGNHKGDKSPASSQNGNPFLRLAQAIDAEALEQSFDYMSLNRVCWMVLRELLKKAPPILDAVESPDNLKPDWSAAEGKHARLVITSIFLVLFRPGLPMPKKEASAVADVLFNLTKALGRIVHTSTGVDWDEALKCTCDAIPSCT